MIEAHDLTKTYGDFVAVDHVGFSVEAGESFGLLGPNGAGKSTTMRMVMGLDRPTALRFSFYLSIPTMIIASLFSLVRDPGRVGGEYVPAFAVGFIVSFIVALVVVRFFLGYVAKHDLKPFAWYRIAAGVVLLMLVAVGFFA